MTAADGGTLYVVSEGGDHLDWKILQNETMGTRMGGTSGIRMTSIGIVSMA